MLYCCLLTYSQVLIQSPHREVRVLIMCFTRCRPKWCILKSSSTTWIRSRLLHKGLNLVDKNLLLDDGATLVDCMLDNLLEQIDGKRRLRVSKKPEEVHIGVEGHISWILQEFRQKGFTNARIKSKMERNSKRKKTKGIQEPLVLQNHQTYQKKIINCTSSTWRLLMILFQWFGQQGPFKRHNLLRWEVYIYIVRKFP